MVTTMNVTTRSSPSAGVSSSETNPARKGM